MNRSMLCLVIPLNPFALFSSKVREVACSFWRTVENLAQFEQALGADFPAVVAPLERFPSAAV
jgi:hypothetical protein